jgi:SAM-dependent methyltransferase
MPTPRPQPGNVDWGLGRYEATAAELEPAAAHVVSLARVKHGERVLDIATGTGNAALAAARKGATATGIDASSRLIELARQRANAERLPASFHVGDLHELPFESGSFECVTSVFGLIFAADPQRAVSELLRVLAPGGRGLISVWVPAGAIDAMVGVFMRAAAQAASPPPPRLRWSDEEAVAELFSPHGVELRWHDAVLEITAGSPEEYLDRQRSHPMSVAMTPLLERSGSAAATFEQALAVLRDGNEDSAGFLVRSPYRVIEILRPLS